MSTKEYTAIKDYRCDYCKGQIAEGDTYIRTSNELTLHPDCYTKSNKNHPERKPMANIYTMNEILDSLKLLAKKEDSITALLRGGDFRTEFDRHVLDLRAQRDTGSIADIADRIATQTINDTEVYDLDDIQGALNKRQFQQFIAFIKDNHGTIDINGVNYIAPALLETFIKQTAPITTDAGDEEAYEG